MSDEIIGIRFAVPLDIGSLGIRWIRPPIIPFRIKIMSTSSRAGAKASGDGDRFEGDLIVRFFDGFGDEFFRINRYSFGIWKRGKE